MRIGGVSDVEAITELSYSWILATKLFPLGGRFEDRGRRTIRNIASVKRACVSQPRCAKSIDGPIEQMNDTISGNRAWVERPTNFPQVPTIRRYQWVAAVAG